MLNSQLEVLSIDDKLQICKSIQFANELTQLDMGEVKSQNSKHARFWDRLNTSLYEYASANKYLVKRGPWEFVILVKGSVIFTLMKESRFETLKKTAKNDRKCQNYINLLAKLFNKNVISTTEQESLFTEEPEEDSDDILRIKVEKFLHSVYENEDNITNHVIILFDKTPYGLLSIRQVIINKDFNIAEDDDFSNLITQQPSITLEEGNDTESTSDTTPTVKLKLKAESIKKANC